MNLFERMQKKCARCRKFEHAYLSGDFNPPIDDCRVVTYFDHNAGAIDGTDHCNARRDQHCAGHEEGR